MLRHKFVTAMAVVVLVTVAGCNPADWEEPPAVMLIGVDGERAFYQYYEGGGTFEYSLPSTVWVADLTTGDSRKLHELPADSSAAAWGDHYIFDEFDETDPEGWTDAALYARQISTDERFEVFGADEYSYYVPPVLSEERVALLTPENVLLIYDLPDRSVVQELELGEDALGLVDFDGDRVLIEHGDGYSNSEGRIIDLSTQETVDIPQWPGAGENAGDVWESDFFLWCWLSGRWVTGYAMGIDEDGFEGTDVWGYCLDTSAWTKLATYEGLDIGESLTASGGMADVVAMNDTHVLTYYLSMSGLLRFDIRYDLIEFETGTTTVINAYSYGLSDRDPGTPILEGREIYWIDGERMQLNILDIDTQEERVISLDYPGK